jgi:hypothetical protein
MDLLTVLAHELGHVIGRGDLDPHTDAHNVMAGELAAGTRLVPADERVEGGDQLSGISDQSSAIRDQWSVMGDRLWSPESGGRGQGSGVGDLWSTFDQLNDPHPASRISHSAFRIRDALFAHLDDRAGAMTDDYDSLAETDDSSKQTEDGPDVWGSLYGLDA